MRKRAESLARGLFLILIFCVTYLLFYKMTDTGFICPINHFTGYLCSFCGVSRMCVSLLSLDLFSAFYYNAAVMMLLPLWAIIAVHLSYRYVRYGETKLLLWHCISLILSVIVLIAFCIFRNIIDLGLSPEPKFSYISIVSITSYSPRSWGHGGRL